MNKAIKYIINPTKEQKVMYAKKFGCCRKVWNLMLADKTEHYKKTKTMLCTTPAMYKKEYPYLKEADSLALANVQLNLQRAYKNFFENKKAGFPKFKSKKHGHCSYTTNNQKGTAALEDKAIKLPKLGLVKAKLHRLPKGGWHLKSATVSKDSGGKYYASVLFEYEANITPAKGNKAVGLDYKSDGLYVSSDNEKCGMPHYYRQAQRKLARAQRKLRNKHSGSNNYKKQVKKIAILHKRIADRRRDFLHKKSAEITNQYDIVCVEDLDMKAMANKGFGNGKATLDNGYGMFLNMLEYKLSGKGKHFVKIDKWYPSSQACSHCGKVHPEMKDLSIRVMSCGCGFTADRDYNAAVNIKNEGLKVLTSA